MTALRHARVAPLHAVYVTHPYTLGYKHYAPVKESPATPSRATADQCSRKNI